MPTAEDNEIELRTEEVNEILTATPQWVLRWGLYIVFILIAVAITLSYFIKYPDVLRAQITLTTLNPPVTLIAKTNGKLTNLLVKNNELVFPGQPIAVIENTANYKDVLYLNTLLLNLSNNIKLTDSPPEIFLENTINVGELTPTYLLVIKSLKDLTVYKNVDPNARQIELLKKDLINYSELFRKYKKQEEINKEQLGLVETDYQRDKNLFENKVIAARDYENKKKEYLGALSNYENIKITLSNTQLQLNIAEKNILLLQIEDYKEENKLKDELLKNIGTAIAEIKTWKQKYLIESPVKGRVSFFNVWSVNQNIQSGEELFSIVPIEKQEFIGKCALPIANTGKLQCGQKVNIKLTNYPYSENGMLEGIVFNISEVPNKENYLVDVKLKNGLVTSYNKTLVYKEEMKGTAEIITKNLSVMDRIFFNFRKLVDKN